MSVCVAPRRQATLSDYDAAEIEKETAPWPSDPRDLETRVLVRRPLWPDGIVSARFYVRHIGEAAWHCAGTLIFTEPEWRVVGERLEGADFRVEEG